MALRKIYRQKNKARIRGVANARRKVRLADKQSPFSIHLKLRKRVWRFIRRKLNGKGQIHRGKGLETLSLLGCSIEDFKGYLEKLFQEGMTWQNWSFSGWHLDHIKPLSSFDPRKTEQLKEAWHYTNLQPLWREENLRKSNKYNGT